MRSYALAAIMAGGAIAAPRPQGLDFGAIDEAGTVPAPSIPVVNAEEAASIIPYVPTAAASSVAAAVQANPSDTSINVKRDNSACAAQPNSDDTAENFLANTKYSDAANAASSPPAGYSLSFKNLKASSNAYGYLGYSTLDSYDVSTCASRCNGVVGCSAFNIYFERDPSVDPTATCSNPPSEEVIKCVYWGGALSADTAVNDGQYRRDFHVVIAGSNGYTSTSIATPAGYSPGVALGNAAINAPLDCNKADTYMGVKIFSTGPFDAGRCAAACTAQSEYNLRHPPKTGQPKTCQFFNTYVLYKNLEPVGQYCSLYNETWAPAFATNKGQNRGSDKYTISYSFAFSNGTAGADKPVGCTNPTSPK